MVLDERDLEILRLVVDTYVRRGVPVSSRALKEITGINLSTASIRAVMHRLERLGCLSKPHTSAGRIPTDEGYRRYVDDLQPVAPYSDAFTSRFREEMRDRTPREPAAIMATASRVLAALSQHFAVAYGAVVPETRVLRIQLVGLDGMRLLVVVHLAPEDERAVVLRMERPFSGNVVRRAEDLINGVIRNTTLADARDALGDVIRDNVTDEGIIMREVAIHRDDILSEPPAVEFYFEETGFGPAAGELLDPKLAQLLIRLLQNKSYLTAILSERLDDRLCITIGREHADEELRRFSMVTASYRMRSARGVLGVIGPTRMRYDMVGSLVDSAARELQAFGEELF